MGKRILIVEDTKTIPEVIKVYLLGHDFTYLQAANGEEGLQLVRQDPPDLVISDIKMPVRDGLSMCDAIKADARTRRVPVILLTSLSDDEARRSGRKAGADAFLNKPINARELLQLVKRLLGL